MGSKKLVEIFKYTLLIISGLLSHVFTLYTTFNLEFVKAQLGGWLAYFGASIEALLIMTIFFIFYPKYAIGDTKKIEKKGYSKQNNLFWIIVGGLLGYIYVVVRRSNPAKYLAILIDKLDKNIIPSSELIQDSGFSSKHPLWKKYLELKSNKAQAAKRLAEKRKKEDEESKKRKAEEREKREQEKKNRLLALKKKYGEDATKALAGKIWVNMSFELYRQAQVMRPKGRKFGKKFENVVNGEERHTYRFDPYENRQGKISYNYEITTKDGLISGWKNLETN